MKLEFSPRFSKKKSSNIEFHENLSRGSPAVRCGRTDRRTDMTKLTVALRNFAITSKNQYYVLVFRMISKYHVACKVWQVTLNCHNNTFLYKTQGQFHHMVMCNPERDKQESYFRFFFFAVLSVPTMDGDIKR